MNRKTLEKLLRDTHSGYKISEIEKNTLEVFEIDELEHRGLINVSIDKIRVDHNQRLRIFEEALKLNSDPEKLSEHLNWHEFENLIVQIFEKNNYTGYHSLIFKDSSQKFQIDVLGIVRNNIFCIDCKHWSYHGGIGTIKTVVHKQIERTERLSLNLDSHTSKLGLRHNNSYFLLPIVIVLPDIEIRFVDNVPVIPILRVEDFLYSLPLIIDSDLKYFKVTI